MTVSVEGDVAMLNVGVGEVEEEMVKAVLEEVATGGCSWVNHHYELSFTSSVKFQQAQSNCASRTSSDMSRLSR